MNIIYAQSRYDLLLLTVTIIYKEQHRDFKQKKWPELPAIRTERCENHLSQQQVLEECFQRSSCQSMCVNEIFLCIGVRQFPSLVFHHETIFGQQKHQDIYGNLVRIS